MARIMYLAIGAVIIGIGLSSCSAIVGCNNPTGYCGNNVPDPDRIGGPSWFLSTTPEERMKYHVDSCLSAEAIRTSNEASACARTNIAQDAHQYCVLYYLPPRHPKDDAEAAEREMNFSNCKNNILAQHGL